MKRPLKLTRIFVPKSGNRGIVQSLPYSSVIQVLCLLI